MKARSSDYVVMAAKWDNNEIGGGVVTLNGGHIENVSSGKAISIAKYGWAKIKATKAKIAIINSSEDPTVMVTVDRKYFWMEKGTYAISIKNNGNGLSFKEGGYCKCEVKITNENIGKYTSTNPLGPFKPL